MSVSKEHAEIRNFRQALKAGTVHTFRAQQFDRWRQGPKCSADPALREAADELWQQYQQVGPSAPKPPAAPISEPTPRRDRRDNPTTATSRRAAASAQVLGEPFHNPYTFLPFGDSPTRRNPTPLTQDELERDRFTGILELEIETLSPLLTCSPVPEEKQAQHKKHRALTIGNDVIVPATGIRGALRTLLAILTGGTLSFVDEEVWLCQGRDLPLGPAGRENPQNRPTEVFLAEVEKAGSLTRSGTLRLGTTKLVPAETVENADGTGATLPRPSAGKKVEWLYANEDGTELRRQKDAEHPWRLKLSGRPVNRKGKREGLFLPGPTVLADVAADLWAAYIGRNVHGDHKALEKRDLVWLEAKAGRTAITSVDDIASLQWARWGRRGEHLLDVIVQRHRAVLPDSINPDGLVDEVTDLFGQVPRPDLVRHVDPTWKKATDTLPGPAGPFAARVRPENLVFQNAAATGLLKDVTLAPLSVPHPGCAAFYRDEYDFERVANGRDRLRGYKVYRTTSERGEAAPWHYAEQAVYGPDGRPEPMKGKVNKTVDLLAEGQKGTLRLACRSLSRREVALLLAASSVDWRLGGGKPLGLGHCRVTKARLVNEMGKEVAELTRSGAEPAAIPADYKLEVDTTLATRIQWWQASQEPVERLRYPRAVVQNRYRKSRGGHVWFSRHANPRKATDSDDLPLGLEVMYVGGDLERQTGSDWLAAQVLPRFDPENPQADVLYGYDLFVGDGDEWSVQLRNRQTIVKKVETFDPERHARPGGDRSSGNQQKGRDSRQADRARRGH